MCGGPSRSAIVAQVTTSSGDPVYVSVSVFLTAEFVVGPSTPLPDSYVIGEELGEGVHVVSEDSTAGSP